MARWASLPVSFFLNYSLSFFYCCFFSYYPAFPFDLCYRACKLQVVLFVFPFPSVLDSVSRPCLHYLSISIGSSPPSLFNPLLPSHVMYDVPFPLCSSTIHTCASPCYYCFAHLFQRSGENRGLHSFLSFVCSDTPLLFRMAPIVSLIRRDFLSALVLYSWISRDLGGVKGGKGKTGEWRRTSTNPLATR